MIVNASSCFFFNLIEVVLGCHCSNTALLGNVT